MTTLTSSNPIIISGIGDSLSYGNFATLKSNCFLSKLQELIIGGGRTCTLFNNGVGGADAVSTVSTGVPATVNSQNPNVIVIELGTNDYNTYTSVQFQANLTTLVGQINKSSNPLIVFCTTWGGSRASYDTAILAISATVPNSLTVNLLPLWNDISNSQPSGVATFGGVSDGWHPNDTGHLAIATLIYKSIFNIGSRLPQTSRLVASGRALTVSRTSVLSRTTA